MRTHTPQTNISGSSHCPTCRPSQMPPAARTGTGGRLCCAHAAATASATSGSRQSVLATLPLRPWPPDSLLCASPGAVSQGAEHACNEARAVLQHVCTWNLPYTANHIIIIQLLATALCRLCQTNLPYCAPVKIKLYMSSTDVRAGQSTHVG